MNTQQSTETYFNIYQQSIADAAYYKAEKRGFMPGFEAHDWAAAEAEVFSNIISGTESNWYDGS